MDKTLINGQYGDSINASDRGLQYGDGLFETILVEFGCPCYLEEHLQRLQKGSQVLGFPPLNKDILEREIFQLIETNQCGVIKLLISRGVGKRGFLPPKNPNVTRLVSFSATKATVKNPLLSLDLVLCHTQLSRQPLLAGLKHLNQLERVLARSEFGDTVSTEGLMLDVEGVVIEGTMSNIFIVSKGVLMTPTLENAGVRGIIRDYLIAQATQEGMDCREMELSVENVIDADEVFMTNSLMPIRAIKQLRIDDKAFIKEVGPYAHWALDSVLADIQHQVDQHAGKN